MTYAIECRQLTNTWPGKPPVQAVRGIDLQVEQGTCFGVLGPNGAGKTTTIEICEGLLQATSGDAFVLGKNCDPAVPRSLSRVYSPAGSRVLVVRIPAGDDMVTRHTARDCIHGSGGILPCECGQDPDWSRGSCNLHRSHLQFLPMHRHRLQFAGDDRPIVLPLGE